MTSVKDIDLLLTMKPEESEKRISAAQRRLIELRLLTAGLRAPFVEGPALVVVFEGFDAAGKGGAIKRVVSALDPRHVTVVPIGPPTELEKAHHFLWRFGPHLPARAGMTVFDRSWYGRLLVERVEGYVKGDDLERSTREIVDFERALSDDGVTLVKFWLHVSADEQLRRFESRANDPLRQWKLTPDDWRNREKRDAYLEALDHVFKETDAPHARWTAISGENKPYARVAVLESLVHLWEKDLQQRGFATPEPPTSLSK